MNWQTIPLGELAEFRNGINYDKSSFGQGLKVIGVADFQDYTKPHYESLEEINPEGVVREEDLLQNLDILFVRSNGNKDLIGRSMLIDSPPESITFSGFCIRARFKNNDVIPQFYAYVFRTDIIRQTLSAYGSGTNISNLNQKILSSLEVPIPPKQTQQRIVEFISAYDDFIHNNNCRIALLESSIQLIYKEWFVKLRFPGYEQIKIVDGIPEKWSYQPLEEVCHITMGQSPSSNFYNTLGQGLPFHQGVKDFGSRFVEHETFCTQPNRIAEQDDILCSVRAPVGRLNITLDKIIIGRGLSSIRNRRGYQSFQFYQLKSHFFQEDMIGGGTIFDSVTKKQLGQQMMLVPTDSVLQAFEKISKPVDEQIVNLYLQNQKLREARDQLLPQLMNGSIAV
ncbi:restriction endonuclease subunit S [Nostoc sp. UIC 10607]|uniref:restriction endonuclease subunit S n=1 Tax=Nostoc sp. UIC 10607 TaxID=3045935 RepID=UPI0039A1D43D